MSREIDFYVIYRCSHCARQLETRTHDWDGWRRCPHCNGSTLPPELITDRVDARRREALRDVDNAVVYIPAHSDAVVESKLEAPAVSERSTHTSPARLIFTTGFALSLFLVLLAFLERKSANMMIFGILTIVFLVLLARSPRSQAGS